MNRKNIFEALKAKKITVEQAKILCSELEKRESKIKYSDSDIAVIGMSGRYPKVNNMRQYWDILENGKNCITNIPKSRWDMDKYFDSQIGKAGKIYCNYIGMIDDVECFDPLFFEITPSEAEAMEPLHRIFMEEGYKAFEDAGYSRSKLNGVNCGVYAGMVTGEYEKMSEDHSGKSTLTGSSNAIAVARLSYFLNLKGPALAIDTACSSSMACTHLAVQALNKKEIDMALVGGSSVYISPEGYSAMCSAGMLSPDGRCKTFDNNADGFVPAEGAGALVLKRLKDAVRDHDNIHGVIIASGMNQDGKTNGITAPSLTRQIDLISDIYERFQIDPATISYAELHGTGTKLGDPIELEALAAAFSKQTDMKNYCAIGSVKSNLGHTSAVSGIAGIEKVLLCMQHRELVPTLHVKEPNKNFDFENSPFYINTETRTWAMQKTQRRACISSFGFSGTNTHVIIQEYIRPENLRQKRISGNHPGIFVLTAKNEHQLKEYVKNMLEFVQQNTSVCLTDILYTLQVGREPLKERLAVITESSEDLTRKLQKYLSDGTDNQYIFQESVKRSKNVLLLNDGILNVAGLNPREIIEHYFKNKKIDWETVYEEQEERRRISLPTTPLEREVFWFDKNKSLKASNVGKEQIRSFPLLKNSTMSSYRSTLTMVYDGEEFFLNEHRIKDEKVVCGAAVLEMAREAGELVSKEKITGIEDVVWMKPMVIDYENKKVEINVQKDGTDQIYFEVTDGKEICAQGKMVHSVCMCSDTIFDCRKIIEGLQKTDFSQLYRKNTDGVSYGSHFRVIQMMYANETESMAILELRDRSVNTKEELCLYPLHPGFLDGAFQTIYPFVKETGLTYLPFSVKNIHLENNLSEKMYVYTRKNNGRSEGILSFDIDILDEAGNVLVKIEQFKARVLEKDQEALRANQVHCLVQKWSECPPNQKKKSNNAFTYFLTDSTDFEVRGNSEKLYAQIKKINQNVRLVQTSDLEQAFCDEVNSPEQEIRILMYCTHEVDRVLNILKSLMILTGIRKILIENLYDADEEENSIYEQALTSLFKTAKIEKKSMSFKNIGIRFSQNPLIEICKTVMKEFDEDFADIDIRYEEGSRLARKVCPADQERKFCSTIELQDGDTCLITGGLGGVGYIMADYICKNYKANVILTGRTAENSGIREKLSTLNAYKGTAVYRQCDISQSTQTEELIDEVKKEYGDITGVIHSAGVVRDSLIVNKSVEIFVKVLAPKIEGIKNLDMTLKDENLKFFAAFSSFSSVLGNLGQSDYCFANGFMDQYMEYREKLCCQGTRFGKSITINWPYWAEGGMQIPKEAVKRLKEEFGMVPLSNEEGIRCFERALKCDGHQLICTIGNPKKINKVFGVNIMKDRSETKMTENAGGAIETSGKDISAFVMDYLKEVFSGVIKIKVDKIDETEYFDAYGLDSIVIMSLTRQLEKDFGELPKTIFFEYETLEEVAKYFEENYTDTFRGMQTPSAISDNLVQSEIKKEAGKPVMRKEETIGETEDIAIIGIAGRYPQADSLGEFWDNLKQGRDCITEIPCDRWNHDKYYCQDNQVVGKSCSKWGGFIKDADKFDPLFFSIAPGEADFLDPQVRLFLENVWNTVEDAGYTRASLAKSRVGVFVGVMYGMYELYQGEIKGERVPVSSSFSAIANRVSYFMNFHGPSIAIDTMCSSSLTSLHLACESIRRGECGVAVAGGVNLSIHPNKYLLLSQGNFASTDGRCRAFGKDGDGYVPGEGVGSVLLKPLSNAVEDKDYIYAVIKGSAINSGGKTNGFTVPSPVAQADVIGQALKNANVKPGQISYVEAHGTGTSLGDPIEINGLSKNFQEDRKEFQFCAIGSVKSNVGHLESAAGIVALSKVVLQLKNKKLVPSLQSDILNPNIRFDKSPFIVQHCLEDWKQTGQNSDKQPLCAGISAFGAGGSNSHVVVEEYMNDKGDEENTCQERIYVFSAKNEERLKKIVENFCVFLSGKFDYHIDGYRMPDIFTRREDSIAYTLQTGREEMEERLAVVCNGIYALIEKLKQYLAGKYYDDMYMANIIDVKENDEFYRDIVNNEKELTAFVEARDLRRIAYLWSNGMKVEWNLLYNDNKPFKMPLPVYQFAKERHWVLTVDDMDEAKNNISESEEKIGAVIVRNMSSLNEMKYLTTITGHEFFIKDHIVGGRKVLPGAVYLEIVTEAAKLAYGHSDARILLGNVIWLQPFLISEQEENRELFITLRRFEDGWLKFRIFENGSDGADILYCEGVVKEAEENRESRLDLDKLRAGLERGTERSEIYELFEKIGISYGNSMRCINKVYRSENEALVELEADVCTRADFSTYTLHPSILDGAFQSNSCWGKDRAESKGVTQLPFSFDNMYIGCPTCAHMYAYIRNNRTAGKVLQKMNIDICDDQGQVCVSVKNMVFKGSEVKQIYKAEEKLLFTTVFSKSNAVKEDLSQYSKKIAILCNTTTQTEQTVKNSGYDEVMALNSEGDSIDRRYISYSVQLLRFIKKLFKNKLKGTVLVRLFVDISGENIKFKGLGGFLKSVVAENCKIVCQLVMQDEKGSSYKDTLTQVEQSQGFKTESIWKDNGVYLITGGAGKLGMLVAEDIVSHTRNAIIILIGRRELTQEISDKVGIMERNNARIIYESLDVENVSQAEKLAAKINSIYGSLTGVIYCAGVLHDSLIPNKKAEDFMQVLSAKVLGVENIDRVFSHANLQLFIIFSSMASVIGNVGQADYACANGYLDAFAAYRNKLVESNERYGQTISINWPYWEQGGMKIDEESVKISEEETGLAPISNETGIELLHMAVSAHNAQIIPAVGDRELILNFLLVKAEEENNEEIKESAQDIISDEKNIKKQLLLKLKKVLAEEIKLVANRIDERIPLEDYGIDSVMILRLTHELEKDYGTLPKTLFFDNQNLRQLTDYLYEEFAEKTKKIFGTEQKSVTKEEEVQIQAILKEEKDKLAPTAEGSCNTEFAIIGLAGKYPKSDNLDQYWENLKNGNDCISEVPENRWNQEKYFDPDKTNSNKTYAKWGGFIDGIENFDSKFFKISPAEAEIMDPQERMFLECVYHAIEDSGYTADTLSPDGSRVGVYVGVMSNEYQLYGAQAQMKETNIALNGCAASIANRVSYYYGFHGPSMTVDTMCSSSLVSVHLACSSIKNGDCDIAVAGGVNLIVHPNKYLILGNGRFASSVGRCQTFAKGGDGYTPGEGIGAVVIKEKKKAIADGDQIYGIIKGSSVNHGGKTNGYTVPNPSSQEQVISRALERAGVNPAQVSFLEAHGTGTALGDPIEIAALTRAYRKKSSKTGYCKIGSAKSIIGHCESAAGIAGITKVLLQMKYKKIVPTIHSEELNPDINFEDSPFVVAREYEDWVRPVTEENGIRKEVPRIAGISAFGAGGTNAHIILEEFAEEPEEAKAAQAEYIIPLSAATQKQLKNEVENLDTWLQQNTNAGLDRVAHTLQTGRVSMKERAVFIVSSAEELKEALKGYLNHTQSCIKCSLKVESPICDMFEDEEEMQSITRNWYSDGKIRKIAELWAEGMNIDWMCFYPDRSIRKISLPGYPFLEKPCWVSKDCINLDRIGTNQVIEQIHPFLHKNISDITGLQYETILHDTDRILADHKVNGKETLPAVIYLEMVATAFVNAQHIGAEDEKQLCIEDVMLRKPGILKESSLSLITRLSESARGMKAVITEKKGHRDNGYFAAEISSLNEEIKNAADTEDLRRQCATGKVDGVAVYGEFEKAGLEYGAGQRGIEYLLPGRERVVSRIVLPEALKAEFDVFLLHPCILDSALQSAIGFVMNGDSVSGRTEVPCFIAAVKIYRRCTDRMWAVLEKVSDQAKDIKLLDDTGCLCVKLEHVIYRKTASELPDTEQKRKKGTQEPGTEVQKDTIETSVDSIYEKTAEYLKGIFIAVLKMSPEDFEEDAYFEDYGVDSVMIMNINEKIEKDLGKIPKTLLFEYQNLNTLANYFIEEYEDKLNWMFHRDADDSQELKERVFAENNYTVNKQKSRPAAAEGTKNESLEVAIIGISGKYAQSEDLEEYWNHILNGDNCITEIPKERWEFENYYNEGKNIPGKSYTKWGGFLKDADCFEPKFFHITPRDAVIMDPQERLFMECAYSALEDAGYTRQTLGYKPGSEVKRNVGVFVGIMNEEYHFYAIEEQAKGNPVVVADNISHVANRFSYYCDFHGPSITLDTMCSSSSVAIHMAVNAIKNKECEAAVAGGVNAILHPNKYLVLSSGKFASTDGRCRSFGEGGTGYVPGEGVGAVLLKEKNAAIADGDHIYGIIKGTSINHGGKTNGYTVPNLLAQKEVIESALSCAKVTPDQISFIEAHGTGTALGDPIEINALDKVFKAYNVDRQSCAVGSVKSNIGHCESASGIAALTKVLLQMKYGTIVPSLHSEVLNPNIDFENSCFYVPQEAREWKHKKRNVNDIVLEEKRIAGISSFGAGGTNAHIIVEEYNAPRKMNENQRKRTVIVLSALKEDALRTIAERLLNRIKTDLNINLHELAYTLIVGREALEIRVAFAVSDMEEVKEKLQNIIGEQNHSGIYYGNTYDKKKHSGIKEENPDTLCRLWAEGVDVDLTTLYKDEKPQKISLPTYPFTKEHYFITRTSTEKKSFEGNGRISNKSSLYRQEYTAIYRDSDSYILNHCVNGIQIVPGAMLIEDIRNAASQSLETSVFIMKDIVFINPLDMPGREKSLSIHFEQDDSGLVFQAKCGGKGNAKDICEGKILSDSKEDYEIRENIIDLNCLQSNDYKQISGKECYAHLKKSGLDNMEALQSIESIRLYSDFALGYLKDQAQENSTEEILRPSVLNGAFQCVVGLLSNRDEQEDGIYLPFSIGEIRIYDSLKEKVVVYITDSQNSALRTSNVLKFDIVIMDEKGRILVEVDEFSIKSLKKPPCKEKDQDSDNLQYSAPKWVPVPFDAPSLTVQKSGVMTVIFGSSEEFYEEYKKVCEKEHEKGRVILVKTGETGHLKEGDIFTVKGGGLTQYIQVLEQIEQEYVRPDRVIMYRTKTDYEKNGKDLTEVYQLYYISRAFMKLKQRETLRLEILFTAEAGESYPEYEALAGFAKSIEKENPFYQYKVIEMIEAGKRDTKKEALAALHEFADCDGGCHQVRYQEGMRYLSKIIPVTEKKVNTVFEPEENKSYVITGGVGHLSMVFAEYLAKKKGCRVLLTGRRILKEEDKNKLNAFKECGMQVIYVSADISTEEGICEVYKTAKKEFGSINGIIHSAGVIRDAFLMKKTTDEMEAVFAPKVYGTRYLDEYFKDENLDFFIVFSSIAGVFGNIGQSDYSYANSFMDYFVNWRNKMAKRNRRLGRTISLDWPLWESGMQVAESVKDNMKKQAGFVSINEDEGIQAFRKSFSIEEDEIVITKRVQ